MNTSIKISRWLLFLTGGLFIAMVACKKEKGGAAPVINKVRALDSTKRDTSYASAVIGSTIVIQGANFDGLQHVYFNDADAPFNAALSSSVNIIVTIPLDAPTEAINPNVPNTIRVVTSGGSVTYKFVSAPPPPSITSITNENTVAGETIVLTGTSFYFVSKVIFPGN